LWSYAFVYRNVMQKGWISGQIPQIQDLSIHNYSTKIIIRP
jgi:hypothetical protein